MGSGTTEIDINAGGKLTFGSASDGGSGCRSSWSTSGSKATLEPGQTCKVNFTYLGVSYSFDAKLMTGSGSESSNMLTFLLGETFTGTAVSGATTTKLAGTVSVSSSCTK